VVAELFFLRNIPLKFYLLLGVFLLSFTVSLAWYHGGNRTYDYSKHLVVVEDASGSLTVVADSSVSFGSQLGAKKAWSFSTFPSGCLVAQAKIEELYTSSDSLSNLSVSDILQWEQAVLAAQHLCTYEAYSKQMRSIGTWLDYGYGAHRSEGD